MYIKEDFLLVENMGPYTKLLTFQPCLSAAPYTSVMVLQPHMLLQTFLSDSGDLPLGGGIVKVQLRCWNVSDTTKFQRFFNKHIMNTS